MTEPADTASSRSTVHWLTLLIATAATWVPIVGLYRLVAEPAPGAIATAAFVADASAQPPAVDAPFAPVALPDDWRATHPRASAGWYRLRFHGAGDERLAVYLPSVAMNAAAYVNGRLVGTGGSFAPTLARNANRPLLFPIPARSLVAGENVLDLRVVADLPGDGFLPAPSVAPLAALAPVHARVSFARRTLLWTLVVFRLTAAVFTAAIFAMWRREAYYGWFALCVVAWVVAEANLLIVEPPVSLAAWYWLFNVAIGWWGIFAVRLVLSFIGVREPRAEQRLMVAGLAGSVVLGALAASGSSHFQPLAINAWLTFAFGASWYLFRGVLPRLRRHPDAIELNVVFVVALSVLGCVLFDLAMQLGLRPRGGLAVPPYAAFVAVVGMGWVLVRRFVGALADARALAETLEERVRQKSAEVEASYRRILATERARVLSAERERILRDTDEGLGAQLVSTLALLERPDTAADEIHDGVRAALDDLRLVVDSLDPSEGDLLVMLATVRARMQSRLDAAGIRVEWQVADLPPLADLTPHRVLQLLRVLQDAFTASLAGEDATLRVATRATATAAVVEIVGGKPTDLVRMRARAHDAGATLETDADAVPSVVRLVVPFGDALPSPSPLRGIARPEGVR